MKERHLSQPGQPGFSDPAGSITDRDANFAGDRDTLSDLLAHDAEVYPVGKAIKNSEWFAARTTALALQTPQKRNMGPAILHGLFSRFSHDARWWVPFPLAGVAAVAFLVIPHGSPHRSVLARNSLAPSSAMASEAEFEQHIELMTSNDLIASSDYSQ
jgi:hypothetical protein